MSAHCGNSHSHGRDSWSHSAGGNLVHPPIGHSSDPGFAIRISLQWAEKEQGKGSDLLVLFPSPVCRSIFREFVQAHQRENHTDGSPNSCRDAIQQQGGNHTSVAKDSENLSALLEGLMDCCLPLAIPRCDPGGFPDSEAGALQQQGNQDSRRRRGHTAQQVHGAQQRHGQKQQLSEKRPHGPEEKGVNEAGEEGDTALGGQANTGRRPLSAPVRQPARAAKSLQSPALCRIMGVVEGTPPRKVAILAESGSVQRLPRVRQRSVMQLARRLELQEALEGVPASPRLESSSRQLAERAQRVSSDAAGGSQLDSGCLSLGAPPQSRGGSEPSCSGKLDVLRALLPLLLGLNQRVLILAAVQYSGAFLRSSCRQPRMNACKGSLWATCSLPGQLAAPICCCVS